MSSNQVTITIKASDGASTVFKAIGSSAQSMGQAVSTAGNAAEAGLSRFQATAGKTASVIDSIGHAAQGIAGQELVQFFSESARAAAELEASQARLNASFSALGHSTQDYGDQLDQVTQHAKDLGFTEVNTLDAISRMVQVTGSAGDSLQALGAAEDLARARGMDLVTASQLVARAYDGQGSALKRYGIVLTAGVSGMEAVAEVESKVAGQADAFSNTTAGAMARAGAAFEGFQEKIGGLAGPLAAVIALLPGVSAGFTGISAGAAGIAASFAEDGAAATAFEAAVSPLALTIAAVGLAAGVAVVAFEHWSQVNAQTAQSLTDVKNAVDTVFAGQGQLIGQFEQIHATASNMFDTFNTGGGGMQGVWNNLTGDAAKYFTTQEDANKVTEEFAQTLTALGGIEGGGNAPTQYALATKDLFTALNQQKVSVADVTDVMHGLDAAYQSTAPGADMLHAKLDQLNAQFAAGDIGPQQYIDSIKNLTNYIPATIAAFAKLESATHASALAGSTWGAMAKGNAQTLPGLTQATLADADAAAKLADSYSKALLPAMNETMGAFKAMQAPGQSVTDTLAQLQKAAQAADPPLTIFQRLGQSTAAAFGDLSAGLSDSTTALDGVLGTFKAIDALGQRSQGATDIAQKIVGDPGTYAVVDDLLSKGVISLGEYQAAQSSEVGIVNANAAAQQALNKLRVDEIPALAAAEEGYSAYIQKLAEAGGAQAQLALAMQDTATQQKVATEYSLAYDATLGKIPKSVATTIIASSAQADPVLASILQQYGEIKIGATGTIHVVFPDGTEIDSGIVAIGHELDALENERHINLVTTGDAPTTVPKVATGLAAVAAHGWTATLNAAGDAATTVPKVAGEVSNLDGTTATVTVDANTAPFEASIGSIATNIKPIEIPVEVTPQRQQDIGSILGTAPKATAPSAPPPTQITADTSQFDAAVAHVQAEADSLANLTVMAHLSADASAFDATIGTAQTSLDNLANLTAMAHLSVDGSAFTAALNAAQSQLSQVAQESVSVKLSADSGDVARAAETATQEANGFANGEYQAQLNASDNTGNVVSGAQNSAQTFANGTYQAQLTAADNASSITATAQSNAQAFASGEYQAQLNASDNASSIISAAQGAATAFATTYSADLEAVDNASGVIANVAAELDNLNGKTATTYITTQTVGQGAGNINPGGGQLGKTIQAMALGGTASGIPVLVGEAGPEIAFLPLGTQVIPHGASMAQMAGGGTVGGTQSNVQPNTTAANTAGQKDGVAYYQGLLSAVKSQKQTLHGEIFGNTLFTSAAAAKPGLDALSNLGQQHDQLVQQLQEARQDQQNLGKAATTAGTAMTTAATSATTAIQGTTQATGRLATMIGKLQSLHSLVGGAGGGSGAVDPIKQAIQSFEQTALSSLGQVQQASQATGQALNQDIGKGANQAAGQVSNATGQMSSDLSQLPKDAATSGKAAGAAIGQGLSQGIQKSNVSDQINSVQQQLQQLGSTTQGPSIGVNDQQAQQGIQGVQQGLQQLNGQDANVGVTVNDSNWQKFVQSVQQEDGKTITVNVKTNQQNSNSGGGGGGKNPPPSGQGSGNGGQGGGNGGQQPSGQTPASLNLPLSALVPQSALGRTQTVLPGVPPPMSAAGTGRPTQFVNYGHIHIHPHTADLYQEIAGAFAQMGRW